MPLGKESAGDPSEGQGEAASDLDGEVERLLRAATAERAPAPSKDLIQRTMGRVRRLILLGDLLRLATLEGLWGRSARNSADAEPPNQRHNS